MTITPTPQFSNDTVDLHSPSPLPWPPRDPGNVAHAGLRRICIFSFYDPHGVVDNYVIFFLRKLGEFAETIIFYSNGPLSRDSENKLRGAVDDVILRPNIGFDVLAYKEGLERIDYNREGLYDEVLMVNHKCYGPVFPFSELFEEMESRDCDFWGVSAHAEMTPNPLTGVGTLPYHLNANFIAVRAEMLRSLSFREYWDNISVGASYEEAIMSHEALFTQHFTNLGVQSELLPQQTLIRLAAAKGGSFSFHGGHTSRNGQARSHRMRRRREIWPNIRGWRKRGPDHGLRGCHKPGNGPRRPFPRRGRQGSN
jgi:hypothetical protein